MLAGGVVWTNCRNNPTLSSIKATFLVSNTSIASEILSFSFSMSMISLHSSRELSRVLVILVSDLNFRFLYGRAIGGGLGGVCTSSSWVALVGCGRMAKGVYSITIT